jgi:chloride channel 7
VTTLLTFGSAIPVGLFIPNILAGACLGRAGAQALIGAGYNLRPDVYALMGAAGALAGFSRMTISLAVIFLEITNNVYMLLPLMLVIMTSKLLADHFNPSVYDIVLESNPDIHLLEDDLSEDYVLILDGINAHDMSSTNVVILREFEPLEHVLSLLLQTNYAGYPVVDAHNRLLGLVSRAELLVFVSKYTRPDEPHSSSDLLPIASFAKVSPEVTFWNTPVTRAFNHFRAVGLKHLCVVSETNELVGILTRTDFAALCRHGSEGAEAIRNMIIRKQVACAEERVEVPSKGRRSSTASRHSDQKSTMSTMDGGSMYGDVTMSFAGDSSETSSVQESLGLSAPQVTVRPPSKQNVCT